MIRQFPLVAALVFAMAAVSQAAIIDNSTVTILGTSSTAYPGYPQSDALDQGTTRYSTDFASLGEGASTHLDFDFGNTVTFTDILYTDRTSSGGGKWQRCSRLFRLCHPFPVHFQQ